MTTYVNTERDTAQFVTREPRNDWVFTFYDDGLLNDTISSVTFTVITDSAELGETAYPNSYTYAFDTAELTDTITGTNIATRSFKDSVEAADRAYAGVRVTQDVTETAELADSYTDIVNRLGLIDTAVLDDTISATTRKVALVKEVAELGDRIGNPASITVRSTAELNDYHYFTVAVSELLRDAFQINSAAVTVFVSSDDLRDVAVLDDAAHIQLTYTLVVREEAELYGYAVLPSSGAAFTANVVNWAMSRYTNFPFASAAGDLYASNSNTYVRVGDLDITDPIVGKWVNGFSDGGDSQIKLLEFVYSAGVSQGGVDITVTADVNRRRLSYTYRQEFVSTDDPRNSRVKVGKGFRSRYFQLGFESVAPFSMEDAFIDIGASVRRLA